MRSKWDLLRVERHCTDLAISGFFIMNEKLIDGIFFISFHDTQRNIRSGLYEVVGHIMSYLLRIEHHAKFVSH